MIEPVELYRTAPPEISAWSKRIESGERTIVHFWAEDAIEAQASGRLRRMTVPAPATEPFAMGGTDEDLERWQDNRRRYVEACDAQENEYLALYRWLVAARCFGDDDLLESVECVLVTWHGGRWRPRRGSALIAMCERARAHMWRVWDEYRARMALKAAA